MPNIINTLYYYDLQTPHSFKYTCLRPGTYKHISRLPDEIPCLPIFPQWVNLQLALRSPAPFGFVLLGCMSACFLYSTEMEIH